MTLITNIKTTGLIDQLADEYIPTYTGENLTIAQIVTALLAFQILTPAITMGTIDPTVSRSISVTGDTILRALYRLRDTVGGHIYVDNNRALQWKTSVGEDKGQQIRYRKNLKGITREIDYTTLANRLYAYGAGEGDARIKLSDVEGQEEDYIEDTGSQTEWGGIYPKIIIDKSITHPDTLLAWAQLRLAELKNPRITYRVDTVDLSESTEVDFSFEALQIGSTIKVIDEDLSIDVSAQVVKITHPDLLHPELMKIEVANRIKNIADILGQVYDTQQLIQHVATQIGAGQVIVKGAFTVIDWVTEGETTIVGSNIETGTITATQLITTEAVITESIQVTDGIITNAKIDTLEAGKVIISGAISLYDWTDAEDHEKFDGGVVKVGSISKEGLSFVAFEKNVDTLDGVVDGESYQRVKATDISAGHIKLSSVTVIDGEWYNESGVEIDAAHGINIYGVNNALTTRATKTGTIQCYVGADGKIYAGAGAVILDANGIKIKGEYLIFADGGGVNRGLIAGHATYGLVITSATGIRFAGTVRAYDLDPFDDGVWDLGSPSKRWDEGYINKLYVGEKLYLPAVP